MMNSLEKVTIILDGSQYERLIEALTDAISLATDRGMIKDIEDYIRVKNIVRQQKSKQHVQSQLET